MKLFNISNKPSDKWEEDQRKGFTEIIDVPPPDIPPTADNPYFEVMSMWNRLQALMKNEPLSNFAFYIDADDSFFFQLAYLIKFHNGLIFTPSFKTEIHTEGNIKIMRPKFVKWRLL